MTMWQFKSYFKHHLVFWKDRFLYSSEKQMQKRSILSSVVLIILSFLISFLLIISIPGGRGASFFALFTKLFLDNTNTENFLRQIAIYILAGLAFSFCMSVGIFNIGISGQMMAGAIFGFLMILKVFPSSFRPGFGGQIITVLLMVIGSVSVAVVVATLKIFFKVNEVVSAIMLNWIVVLISAYLVETYIKNNSGGTAQFFSLPLPDEFALYNFSPLTKKFGWLASLIIAFISVIIVAVVLKYTVFGHKLKSIGSSVFGSQAMGFNVKKYQFLSFIISGILSGLLATVVYTASTEKVLTFNNVGDSAISAVPATGFDGIAIGLIALNNPFRIVIVSVLIAFVNIGARPANLNPSTASLVLGIMMYFAALYNLMVYFKPWRYLVKLNIGKINLTTYETYENKLAANLEWLSFQRFLSKQKKKNDKTKFNWFDTSLFEQYAKNKQEIVQEYHHNCATNLIAWWLNAIKSGNIKPSTTFKLEFVNFKHQQKFVLNWFKNESESLRDFQSQFERINKLVEREFVK
ncbi:ABC transporter permease [Mycoplasmoides genitalium]